MVFDALPHMFGQDQAVFQPRGRADDHEFLSAPAPGFVGVAHVPSKDPADLFQDMVPGIVTVGVVDVLEMVDIEENDGKRLLLAV